MLFWHIFVSLLIYGASCSRLQLSCDQVREFVNGHNWVRFFTAHGDVPAQPAAAKMKYMIWDDELAEKAGRWAGFRRFLHNPDKTIRSRRFRNLVGENLFRKSVFSPTNNQVVPNITEALQSWFDEYKNYTFEPFRLFNNGTGHYTQMVWETTNRVGCAISQWRKNDDVNTLFVCNYGPAGNYLGQFPYQTSPRKGYLQCAVGECSYMYGRSC